MQAIQDTSRDQLTYLNFIRSSRMLEREAQRNLEAIWLLRFGCVSRSQFHDAWFMPQDKTRFGSRAPPLG